MNRSGSPMRASRNSRSRSKSSTTSYEAKNKCVNDMDPITQEAFDDQARIIKIKRNKHVHCYEYKGLIAAIRATGRLPFDNSIASDSVIRRLNKMAREDNIAPIGTRAEEEKKRRDDSEQEYFEALNEYEQYDQDEAEMKEQANQRAYEEEVSELRRVEACSDWNSCQRVVNELWTKYHIPAEQFTSTIDINENGTINEAYVNDIVKILPEFIQFRSTVNVYIPLGTNFDEMFDSLLNNNVRFEFWKSTGTSDLSWINRIMQKNQNINITLDFLKAQLTESKIRKFALSPTQYGNVSIYVQHKFKNQLERKFPVATVVVVD